MEKEYAPSANEKKMNVKPAKAEVKKEVAKAEPKVEVKLEEVKDTNQEAKAELKADAKPDAKPEEKKDKKKETPKITKKDFAVARGMDIPASKRHCMYIGSYIKGKSIDQSIKELEEVVILKRIIPMKGEIPHRKGKGMMSGRYPVNTSKLFIAILKGLKGNVQVNGMDLDKTRITEVVSNWASRPQRRKGVRFKRSHVVITAREIEAKQNKEKKK